MYLHKEFKYRLSASRTRNLYEYFLLEVTGGIASIDILKKAGAYYDTISFLKN